MSAPQEVKSDRKYTKDHEWAKQEGADWLIGITAFAVEQLGDITLVSLDVKPGDKVQAHKAFGTIESVKTLSDLYAPFSGTVAKINDALENTPELVNDDCWGQGWMIVITPDDADAKHDDLLDVAAYQKHVEESAH
ncbi:MAG TPA: glycine cleavage system protein GcvH [Polyangiaceae bacterium]|nr:glycine cleavage system protein GcvH [Polyangiaceae bacterium]